MSEKKIKTTPKQFQEFKDAFNEMIEILGVKQYGIYFDTKDLKGSFARIYSNNSSMTAVVYMSSVLDEMDYKFFDPKTSGRHEALHLLLSRLSYLACERFTPESAIDEEDESLVNQLEQAFTKLLDQKNGGKNK